MKKRRWRKLKRLKEINESRKQMTEDGAEEAYLKLAEKENENKLPKVLIVLLPDTHESLVGIIAGRVKERTTANDCFYGNGRRSCERLRAFD